MLDMKKNDQIKKKEILDNTISKIPQQFIQNEEKKVLTQLNIIYFFLSLCAGKCNSFQLM